MQILIAITHTSDFCELCKVTKLCSNATYCSLPGSSKSPLKQGGKNGSSFLRVSGVCVCGMLRWCQGKAEKLFPIKGG